MVSMYDLFRTGLKLNTCSDVLVANCYLPFTEEIYTLSDVLVANCYLPFTEEIDTFVRRFGSQLLPSIH